MCILTYYLATDVRALVPFCPARLQLHYYCQKISIVSWANKWWWRWRRR